MFLLGYFSFNCVSYDDEDMDFKKVWLISSFIISLPVVWSIIAIAKNENKVDEADHPFAIFSYCWLVICFFSIGIFIFLKKN